MRGVFSGVVVVGIGLLGACSGTKVALNERLFALPSLESQGGGCTLYALGSGNSSGSGAGALGLTLAQRSDGGDVILVDVSRDNIRLVERRYDVAFFRSGKLDEFVVPTPTGNGMLLRYWGTLDAEGTAGCAPLEENGPPGSPEPDGGL